MSRTQSRPFTAWAYPLPERERDPAHAISSFESAAEAEDRRRSLAKLLPHGLGRVQCYDQEPCHSAACPICLRRTRRWWTGACMDLLDSLSWRPGWGITASLIPIRTFSGGEPGQFDIERESARIRTRLGRSPLAQHPVIAAWDFSWNEHHADEWERHWQPHLYALLPTVVDIAAVRKELHNIFARGDMPSRTVKIRHLDDAMPAATYCLKGAFCRRISYRSQNGRMNTRKLPLRPAQERELRQYLDAIGITGRLMLRQARRRGSALIPEHGTRSCQRE